MTPLFPVTVVLLLKSQPHKSEVPPSAGIELTTSAVEVHTECELHSDPVVLCFPSNISNLHFLHGHHDRVDGCQHGIFLPETDRRVDVLDHEDDADQNGGRPDDLGRPPRGEQVGEPMDGDRGAEFRENATCLKRDHPRPKGGARMTAVAK